MGQKQRKKKTSQTSGFQQGIFQAMLRFGIRKVFLDCQRSHLKPPSRALAQTIYTDENLFFTSFLQRHKQWFWDKKWQKSSDWHPKE
jgi:hypothetical protein